GFRETAIGDLLKAPLLELADQIAIHRPLGGQSQPPLRMVGRTQAMESPEIGGQNAVGERITLAPPKIPNGAEVTSVLRSRQFGGKHSAETEQPRLDRNWFGMSRAPAWTQLAQPLHGPHIMFVAERAKQTFPECLFPSGVASA